MKSIGNDIVSLTNINKQRTNSARFYTKFVTASELALYQTPIVDVVPFENFVWLLWSVKESAYKYLKRINTGLLFSPVKITIQNINIPANPLFINLIDLCWEGKPVGDWLYSGEVIGEGEKLYFKSIIQNQLIATVVGDHSIFDKIYWGIQSVNDVRHQSQSSLVRQALLNKLKKLFSQENLTIEKHGAGYPIILQQGKLLDILVSLAHHDQFTSYVFMMEGDSLLPQPV
ncbi:4'-phosphopantetheinyl transferase superfamily protein [Mucilaginibacter paludis]|uniref:4'-phosphopantetheinyl transferase n=1 Tax=Mucilaginibacter paludis DSM 18603 TaxID=714943 RepID=H1Y1G1_9SPHI|nr:4'-phosphopantetheinyl transferase superfamily protein [Mucilaginibacter paludis]EHQ30835.1 4'-phosphopantetheinyl transferase [Mucilaginibacter paludis DSM 18603]